MNERIVEIASQAGYQPEVFQLCRSGMEKFAELIILECAKVCADNGMRAGGGNTIVGETFLDASKLIRGNFGLDTFGMY